MLKHLGEQLNWTLVNSSSKYSESYVIWHDTYTSEDYLRKLSSFQQINRFPGSYILGKKNNLAKNLMKMFAKIPNEYDFFPKTWSLPQNLEDLKRFHHKFKSKK